LVVWLIFGLDWGLGDASIFGGWQLEDEHGASVRGVIGGGVVCGGFVRGGWR
jgi:hypothetical protein